VPGFHVRRYAAESALIVFHVLSQNTRAFETV
jgi:hypothetical protein